MPARAERLTGRRPADRTHVQRGRSGGRGRRRRRGPRGAAGAAADPRGQAAARSAGGADAEGNRTARRSAAGGWSTSSGRRPGGERAARCGRRRRPWPTPTAQAWLCCWRSCRWSKGVRQRAAPATPAPGTGEGRPLQAAGRHAQAAGLVMGAQRGAAADGGRGQRLRRRPGLGAIHMYPAQPERARPSAAEALAPPRQGATAVRRGACGWTRIVSAPYGIAAEGC
jgi:hypothetical protein